MSSEGSRYLMNVRFSCKSVVNLLVFSLFCIVDEVVTKTACVIAEKSMHFRKNIAFLYQCLTIQRIHGIMFLKKSGRMAEVCKKTTALC